MKIGYVSWGSTTSGQKNETRAKKKRSQTQWKNKGFRARAAGQKNKTPINLRFPENLQNAWKNEGFRLAETAPRKGDPWRLQARDEKLHWDPTENLRIPCVSWWSPAWE